MSIGSKASHHFTDNKFAIAQKTCVHLEIDENVDYYYMQDGNIAGTKIDFHPRVHFVIVSHEDR